MELTASELVELINKELNRLEVSTEHYPYVGLMAEEMDSPSNCIAVKVFDDYDSDIYDGLTLWGLLRNLGPWEVYVWEDEANSDNSSIWLEMEEAMLKMPCKEHKND